MEWKKNTFSTNDAEANEHIGKNKRTNNLDLNLTPCIKINLKWIVDLNVKHRL